MRHSTVLVAFGANLPGPGGRTPLQSCEWALAQLAAQPGLWVRARSRWFRSTPVPQSGQPDYVNGVARLWASSPPEAILATLHAIEAAGGRHRSTPNAARTLDLDLLAVDGIERDGPLVLPHPRLHERAFVLAPMADVAPDWVHPRLGRSTAELLHAADLAGVAPIPGEAS